MSFHTPPPGVPHSSVGVLLIGLDISLVGYGAACLQAIYYFRRFRSDMLLIKLGVIFVWVLETVNTIFTAHTVAHYLILNGGKADVLSQPQPWTLPVQSSFNAILSCLMHALLGWRIWILSEMNKYPIIFIVLLSLGQLVCGFSVSIQGLGGFRTSSAIEYGRISVLAAFGMTAAGDMAVALCLCYYLHIRKTSNLASTSLLNKIIILTIHNGLLSSSIALFGFITILSIPMTWAAMASCFILGKAYFNTLLSTLNARKALRAQLEGREAGVGTNTIRRQLDEAAFREENRFELPGNKESRFLK
ncbi:unnamed protein product [Cyclocybe aegerita]|uniref:DUF6534 domain-containing protein n=1 Tax=Cyclocybe aegerita TaxID=1973307 RepID=A0A8S0VXX3_CYCAE|nr:unnamed protein product [Cyclocybe aegerita]